MALDLANGYVRKDGSSASNVYYGYTSTPNPADGDFVYSIRRVNTSNGTETISWVNDDPNSFISSWSGRTFSFTTPSTPLGLTWSTSGNSSTLTWNSITGVNKYFLSVRNSSNVLLTDNGFPQQGPYSNQSYTKFIVNGTRHFQRFLSDGTYSVLVQAINNAGSTSSTATIYISPTTISVPSAQYYGHNG